MSAIYEPKGKAREYSPLALNYYKGCDHGCKYCYVPAMFNRFDSNYNHEKVELRKSIPDILKNIESSARKFSNSEKQVLLNFTSDPYNGLEKDLNLTRQILKILLKYNIPVSILTKGGRLIERDIDVFKSFGDNIIIGVSLTFDENTKESKEWEPGASCPSDRLVSLKILRDQNIKTWASFEPVIFPGQSLSLLGKVAKNNLCDYVKIGKLNNYKGIDKNINWSDFLNKAVKICRDYELPFYIKKDLLKFKDNYLFLNECEIDQDFLALKNTKMLTNQLF